MATDELIRRGEIDRRLARIEDAVHQIGEQTNYNQLIRFASERGVEIEIERQRTTIDDEGHKETVSLRMKATPSDPLQAIGSWFSRLFS